MNENTLQCVIKTNSNMNNSLIIGESFFLLYLARLYRGFFFLPTTLRRSFCMILSLFLSNLHSKHRPQREFSFLSLAFTSSDVQSSSFISIRSDSSCDHSDLTSLALQDYARRRLSESYVFFFCQIYHFIKL